VKIAAAAPILSIVSRPSAQARPGQAACHHLMTLLLHLSDPQFGSEQPAVLAALERLVADQHPDVLLLSGNATRNASASEFSSARAFIDRLQVPKVLAVPGNRDIPLRNVSQRLFNTYANWHKAFGDDLEPSHETPSMLVLGVNSVRRSRPAGGELSVRQIEQVVQRLSAAKPRQWKLVFLHHPVAVPNQDDERDLVHGHAEAVQFWRDAGADLVLAGHNRLPWASPLVTTGSVQRVMWTVNAGSALSQDLRPEAGNSVNLLRINDTPEATTGPRQATLERWDYKADGDSFACVSTRELRVR
jgi:3',5'-cyclic AMP phosphodiesterase CpdA